MNNGKKTEIPFSIPYIDEQEIEEVVKVLRGKWITTGEEVNAFERGVKEYLGVNTAVALASCTAALDIALTVNGVGEGDQVLTTGYTFASTVLSIIHRGAEPVFADIEEDTFNIDPARIEEVIERDYRKTVGGLECKRSGKILRGIIVVHFAGQPAEIETIGGLARKYGLFVIEDAAHAIGAVHRGKKIGCGGNLVCFSFYSNKNMTTGEGGMIVTDNAETEQLMRMYSVHGISKSNIERYQSGLPFYDVEVPGFKANLTDIQAALGVVQIKKLDEINGLRNQVAEWYDEALKDIEELTLPLIRPYNYSARHLYPVLLHPRLKDSRDEIILKLRDKGIYPSVHFIPVHFHTFYKKLYPEAPKAPVTEDLFSREISLPIFPGLGEKDVTYVSDGLKEILGEM
jgi:dTDP-4-amino-4,6-dideoxygalactose transaminase